MNPLEVLDELERRRRQQYAEARTALVRCHMVQDGAISAEVAPTLHHEDMTTRTPSAMTLADVADDLQVHLATVKRMIKAGRLPVVKVEGTTRVLREDFEAYRLSLKSEENQ